MGSGIRITANALVLVVLRLLRPVLSMILVVAISRLLGADELGRYTLALSLLFIFTEIAPLGLSAWVAREGARHRDRLETLLANAASVVAALAIALAGVMAVAGIGLGYDGVTTAAILMLSLAVVPVALNTLFEGAFVARERMDCIALVALIENVFKVGGSIAAIYLGYGLQAVVAIIACSYAIAMFSSVLLLRRLGVRVRFGWGNTIVRDLGRIAPVFLLTSICATLTWRVGVFVLGSAHTVEAVGEYGAAWRLFELALVFPQSLCLALYPQIAAAHDDRAMLRWLSETAARVLAAGTLPVAVLTGVMAAPVLDLLYGNQFAAAAPTLTVLIWAIVPYAWVRFNAYALIAADRQHVDLVFNLVATIANFILNLLLVPRHGALGTAIALLATMVGHLAMQQIYFLRALPGRSAPLSIDPAVAAGTIALAICALQLHATYPWLGASLGVVLYLAILIAGGFLRRTGVRLASLRQSLFGTPAAPPPAREAA